MSSSNQLYNLNLSAVVATMTALLTYATAWLLKPAIGAQLPSTQYQSIILIAIVLEAGVIFVYGTGGKQQPIAAEQPQAKPNRRKTQPAPTPEPKPEKVHFKLKEDETEKQKMKEEIEFLKKRMDKLLDQGIAASLAPEAKH
jgi:hypothetical protein